MKKREGGGGGDICALSAKHGKAPKFLILWLLFKLNMTNMIKLRGYCLHNH